MALKAEQGLSIGGKTVLELMREEGPRCRIRRKRYDPCQGGQGKIAKNTLNRDFAAKDPTAKLVADVAEFKVAGAKAYLSPVMDLYNSEIAAWPVARSASFAQAMGMLDGLSDLLQGPAPPAFRPRMAASTARLPETLGGDGASPEHAKKGGMLR